MPILQYKCPSCGKIFDELVKNYGDEALCPDCKTAAVRLWCGTMYSATGKTVKKCSGHCSTCSGCK